MMKRERRWRMAADLGKFRGVIRGKIIELEKDPGLRERDPVEI
jgi:hypothetical protein